MAKSKALIHRKNGNSPEIKRFDSKVVNSSRVQGSGRFIDIDTHEESNGTFSVYLNGSLEKSGFKTLAEAASVGRRAASDKLYKMGHS